MIIKPRKKKETENNLLANSVGAKSSGTESRQWMNMHMDEVTEGWLSNKQHR